MVSVDFLPLRLDRPDEYFFVEVSRIRTSRTPWATCRLNRMLKKARIAKNSRMVGKRGGFGGNLELSDRVYQAICWVGIIFFPIQEIMRIG